MRKLPGRIRGKANRPSSELSVTQPTESDTPELARRSSMDLQRRRISRGSAGRGAGRILVDAARPLPSAGRLRRSRATAARPGRAAPRRARPRCPPADAGSASSALAGACVGRARSAPARRAPEMRQRTTLDEVRRELGDCQRCKLCDGPQATSSSASGNPRAELVFVGEGPGADEDAQGVPFVGEAGQLLTKMIEAMGFTPRRRLHLQRREVPAAGQPQPGAGRDRRVRAVPARAARGASSPKVIVALGKFAAQTLLRDTTPITRLRGQWREYEGIPLMPTFHPAYLLRSPAEKKHGVGGPAAGDEGLRQERPRDGA